MDFPEGKLESFSEIQEVWIMLRIRLLQIELNQVRK